MIDWHYPYLDDGRAISLKYSHILGVWNDQLLLLYCIYPMTLCIWYNTTKSRSRAIETNGLVVENRWNSQLELDTHLQTLVRTNRKLNLSCTLGKEWSTLKNYAQDQWFSKHSRECYHFFFECCYFFFFFFLQAAGTATLRRQCSGQYYWLLFHMNSSTQVVAWTMSVKS